MSSGRFKKIVINSHRFFRDISPEVLNEMPADDEVGFQSLSIGEPELYQAIKNRQYQIVVTPGIRSQYSQEAQREGYTETLLLLIIDYLTDRGLVIQQRFPGGSRRTYPGLPQRHRTFLLDSIDSQADYFVTENPVWLRLADMMLNQYKVTVTSVGGFIRREGL